MGTKSLTFSCLLASQLGSPDFHCFKICVASFDGSSLTATSAANNCLSNCLSNCFNAQVSSGSGDSNFSEPTSLWISERCQKLFAPYFDLVNFGFRFSSLAGVHHHNLNAVLVRGNTLAWQKQTRSSDMLCRIEFPTLKHFMVETESASRTSGCSLRIKQLEVVSRISWDTSWSEMRRHYFFTLSTWMAPQKTHWGLTLCQRNHGTNRKWWIHELRQLTLGLNFLRVWLACLL